MASSLTMPMLRKAVGWPAVVAASLLVAASGQPSRPVCQMGEALVNSVDFHLDEWDSQIEIGLNTTYNCSVFLEFIYLSRDRIRTQLEYIRGNFSTEEELLAAQGEEALAQSVTWAMSHMAKAASLVSAHMHIHGVLSAARAECLSEHLQLLFLMSLRRLKILLHGELRQLWVVFQGTADVFRQGAAKWLTELLELFEADLRTFESIMVTYLPPEGDQQPPPGSRPGPPLPAFSQWEPDGITMSTVEVLRRTAFEEWDMQKPLLRAMLRHVLPRDGYVADLCAGGGLVADFLNETGLLTAYAFDASPNINVLSKGAVHQAGIHSGPVQLFRTFDVVFCLTSAGDFGNKADVWAQAWRNIEAHAVRGAVLSCGSGMVRQQALDSAATNAPALQLDEELSRRLEETATGMCVFWRRGAVSS
mmetsp:Transcript_10921/g.20336  ORF Transcript_10921/g.20336 Transcript_10921/m.20336 type:complete len:419 (+) Transcript_10921:103-1359(+)